MASTVVLTWKEFSFFNRSKLQLLYPQQRAPINNLLDRVEIIYDRMLPKPTKKMWVLYFVLLALFIGSGIWKQCNRRPFIPPKPFDNQATPPASPEINGSQPPRRLLTHDQPPTHPPGRKGRHPGGPPPGLEKKKPHDLPPPFQPPPKDKAEESHQAEKPEHKREESETKKEEKEQEHFSPEQQRPPIVYYYRRRGPISHLKNFTFFIMEFFFLAYPFYCVYSRKKKIRKTTQLVRDLVDIENRQLIVNCQLKVEVITLSAFTLIQLETEASTSLLDRSVAPLVPTRPSKGRKAKLPVDDQAEVI